MTNNNFSMSNALLAFLAIIGPPARLTVEQTAAKLNCHVHDVRILVAAKLLKPLGNPPQSGVKYFSTTEIMRLSSDPVWLAKATNALYRHWHLRNLNKRHGDEGEASDLAA
jgi:hypothetical protein